MNIVFEAVLSEVGSRKIMRLPSSASEKLPSRGMVMVRGRVIGLHTAGQGVWHNKGGLLHE